MEVIKFDIISLLKTSNNIEIPFYQRDYTWTWEGHVKQLLEDICFNKANEYYVGSIILKNKTTGEDGEIIIDGQQRITTFWLILRALQRKFKGNETLINVIFMGFRFTTKDLENNQIFAKIITEENYKFTDQDKRSYYYKNYKEIEKFIQKFDSDQKLNEFYRKFKKIIVSKIKLESDMVEQFIFSQINSTGKELSGFDLIKNDLFHEIEDNLRKLKLTKDFGDKKIDKEFDKKMNYYNSLMKYKNDDSLKDYILRYFISYKTQFLCINRPREIFNAYKKIKKNYNNIDKLYDDLCAFINAYRILKLGTQKESLEYSESSQNIINNLNITNSLNIIANSFGTYSVLMVDVILKNSTWINQEFEFDDAQKRIIYNCFLIIENFIIRRQFCKNLNDNSLTRYIPGTLVPNINLMLTILKTQDPTTEVQYHHVLYYLLFSKDNKEKKYRGPDNEEFKNGFETENIYSSNSNAFCSSFLRRLMKFYDKNIPFLEKGTIEHVLPSDMTKWEKDNYFEKNGDGYGEKYVDIDKVRNTIGNLHLTSINTKLSNYPFKKKLEFLNDLENYNFNKDIRDQKKWNTQIIKERSKSLYERVIKEWNFDKLLDEKIRNALDTTNLIKIKFNELKKSYEMLGCFSKNEFKESLEKFLVHKWSHPRIEKEIFNKEKFAGTYSKKIIAHFIGDRFKSGIFFEKENEFNDLYNSKKKDIDYFFQLVEK